MRMIPKLQTGFVPIIYRHVSSTQQASAPPETSQSKSSSDNELLSDSMKKLIVEKGLPSDVATFMQETTIFSNNVLGGGISGSASQAKEMLLYLNRMHHEKTLFTENLKQIDQIGGKGEAAISDTGGIFVSRNGKIEVIGVNQLRDGERALTNAQLADIRANSTQYAFNNNITSALGNATSMGEIRKVIDQNLQQLTSDKLTYDVVYSGMNDSGKSQLITGLSSMQDITMNDLKMFDIDTLIKKKVDGEDNQKQILHAVNSIYNQLDTNMQVLLALKVKQFNAAFNTDITPYHLILEYVSSRTKKHQSITFDLSTTPNGNARRQKALQEEAKITPLIAYATGKGTTTQIQLSPGNTVNMKVTGQTWGAPVGEDNKVIGQSSLQHFLNKGFGPLVDASNGIYIGDQKVNSSQYGDILFDGQQVSRVYLPITIDAQGTVHPNLNLYKKYEEISNKAVNQQDKVKLMLNDPELRNYVDEEGNWRSEMLKPFFAVNVFADGESDTFGSGYSGVLNPDLMGNGFIHTAESLGENEEALKQTMYKILGTKDAPFYPQGKIYKGVAFLPIRNDATIGAMWASGQHPTITAGNVDNINNASITDYRRIQHMLNDGQQQINYVDASSKKLLNNK